MGESLPTFDLVVATLGRSVELDTLLSSLSRQTYSGFRVVVVDQNEDDRVESLLARRGDLEVMRLRSEPGLSRARNVALPHLAGDVVGFPDDDCFYTGDLLERVARRLAERPDLDGLTGRPRDPDGRPTGRWREQRFVVTRDTVWYCGNSHTMFLRRALVERVGPFDEDLGLGSGTVWQSGEEIDFVARAVLAGARIEYDPELVVFHPAKPLPPAGERALGLRDGASVGYILGKNRYPRRALARMLVRPTGGIGLSLVRRDVAGARFQWATLRGRILGYRAGRRARAAKRPQETWDGLPIAPEGPIVSCVVVWREGERGHELLMLHRAAEGPDYEGDWAWTPPAGARQPGETPDEAAARELREETGLSLDLAPVPGQPSDDVALYLAQAPVDAEIALDAEHDRFEWLPLEQATARCLPAEAAASLTTAAAWLEA